MSKFRYVTLIVATLVARLVSLYAVFAGIFILLNTIAATKIATMFGYSAVTGLIAGGCGSALVVLVVALVLTLRTLDDRPKDNNDFIGD